LASITGISESDPVDVIEGQRNANDFCRITAS
jgi:hypothetical protein